MTSAGVWIAVWIGLLRCCGPVWAQESAVPSPPQSASQGAVIRVSAQLVLVDVAVVDRKTGVAVGPLVPGDVRLAEDGAEQKLLDMRRDDSLPLSVVFLFDTTDTVRPVLRNLGKGAAAVLQHLGPQDEAAVMVFSSHTKLLLDFARQHSFIEDAILRGSNVASREATFLNEDMYEAAEEGMRSTQPQSRRVLLWLTDGTTNSEDALTHRTHGKEAPAVLKTREEATEALLRSGAVSAMLRERSPATYLLMPAIGLAGRLHEFDHFAELTGGPVVTTGKDDAAERMGLLLDALRARYVVSFRPAVSKPAGTHCRLKVTLSPEFFARHPDLRSKDVTVQARQEYVR